MVSCLANIIYGYCGENFSTLLTMLPFDTTGIAVADARFAPVNKLSVAALGIYHVTPVGSITVKRLYNVYNSYTLLIEYLYFVN